MGTNKNDVSTNSKNIAKNYFFLVMLKDLVLDSMFLFQYRTLRGPSLPLLCSRPASPVYIDKARRLGL